jgi:YidC/Oxa1 family membrane protein insertase
MGIWAGFIELLQTGLFVLTQAGGGNLAVGIIGLSLASRLALLPLTYSLARRSQERSRRLAAAQPELERLRKRYEKDPTRLARETMAAYRRHGVTIADGKGLLGGLVQLPVVAGMYTVVRRALESGGGGRFLWISNISRPDPLLAVFVALLTLTVMLLGPQVSQVGGRVMLLLPAAVMLLVLLKFSAGLGLYWGTSTAVAVAQSLLVRRTARPGSMRQR